MKYIDNRLSANIVKLEDANNNYASENVEGALEEIDSKIKHIEANGYDDTQIKQDINNIKNEIGSTALNTDAINIKDAINKVNTRINTVEANAYDDTQIRQGINNIKTEIGTEELTTNSKNIKGSVNELNSQIKDIENKKLNINSIYTVDDLTADGIIEKINECKNNGGGTVILKSTNEDVLINKYINIPCKVTLDCSHNKIVPTEDIELKNGFVFGMNSSDGITWDDPYSSDGCEIRNAFIEAWKTDYTTKGIHVLSSMANINNIKFSNFRQAIVKDTYYTDLFVIERCDFSIHDIRYNDDYLITIGGNGDGLLISQLHFGTGAFSESESVLRNAIHISNCNGGKIIDIINGNIKITNSSELIIENYHSESGLFKIYNSNISIKNSSFLNTKNENFITIGDRPAYQGASSIIYLDNVYFSFLNENKFRPTKDIFDINIKDNSTIKINNCYRRCGNAYLGLRLGRNDASFDKFNALSSKASLNSTLIADRIMDDFHFNTFGGSQSIYFNLSEDSSEWNKTSGEYFYCFIVLMDYDRKLGTISNEINYTTTGKAIAFERGSYSFTGCNIRIYRGTTSNIYDEYVDIPILYEWNNTLVDFGSDIGGFYWQSITPINKSEILLNPCNKIEINNINIKAYMGSKPTLGSWNKGDIVYNDFSGSVTTLGWVYNGTDFIDL